MSSRPREQWSTGGVGAIAVRVLTERPDLELAGVWVHDPSKIGRDAGELAGLPPLGLAATSDRAAPDVAPDWPTAPRDGTYRIVVDGDPSFTCEAEAGKADEDGLTELDLSCTAQGRPQR